MVRSLFYAFMACFSLVASQGFAESSRLQRDFSFKRVTVPSAGATRRITVQIDPNAPRAPSAPSAAGTAVSAAAPQATAPKITGSP